MGTVVHLDVVNGKVCRVPGGATSDFNPHALTDEAMDKIVRDLSRKPVRSCEAAKTGFVPGDDLPPDAA